MAKKQTLIYFNLSRALGGAETLLTDLLKTWQKKGTEIHVAAHYHPFRKLLNEHRIKSTRFPFDIDYPSNWHGFIKSLVLTPLAILWLSWYLLNQKSSNSTVLVSGFSEKFLLSPLATLMGFPVIWYEFGPVAPVLSKVGGIPRLLYNLCHPSANHIITISEYSRQTILSETSVHPDRISSVLIGSDMPEPSDQSPVKHRLVCISRLEPGKGQDLLISAMAQVVQTVPDTTLHIVGTGDAAYTRQLENLISKHHLEKQVVLTGRVDSILEELQSAEVVVFPSMWKLEGFGLVLTEAMSQGKPIVAFDRGPTPEIITNGTDGLLVEPCNTTALATACIDLLTSPKRQKELGTAARATYEQRFTMDQVAANHWQEIVNHAN